MKSLSGRKILLLRSAEDLESSAALLRQYGAQPIACPMLSILPPEDPGALEAEMHRLAEYDWICFTSLHSVRFFAEHWQAFSGRRAWDFTTRLAAIGPATQAALEALNRRIDFIAAKATAEDFLEEFLRVQKVRGQRFLLPLSSIARRTLPDGLRQAGAVVQEVTAYRNVPVEEMEAQVAQRLARGEIDWIFFTSSSTADNFFALLKNPEALHPSVRLASIGPKTSQTLRDRGREPDAEAKIHTLEGMLEAVVCREEGGDPEIQA